MLLPAIGSVTAVHRDARVRLRVASAAAVLCLMLPIVAGAEVQAESPVVRIVAIDSLAGAEFARDSIGSITIGVVSRGELVWTKSYGYADMRTHRLANRRTVYRIGSITKMFTGVMLQQLLASGKVHLSDPISGLLPEINSVRDLPAGERAPTILQLATMTGGLAAEPQNPEVFGAGPVSGWEDKVVSALAQTRYESVPGTRYSYSNIGFAALGLALERASGKSFLAWQRERILDPLQMHRTSFELDVSLRGDLAAGYDVDTDGTVNADLPARELHDGRGYRLPIGCLFTTIDDLSHFMAFQLGYGPESVLSHPQLDRNYAGIVAASQDFDSGYGLGFMALRRGDFTWLGHSGGVPGYSAMMFYDRENQLGVIVFRNATGGKARIGRLAVDALKTLVDAKLDADKAAKSLAGAPRKP